MKLSDRNFACVSLTLVALHLVFFFRQDLLVERFAETETYAGMIAFVVLDLLLSAILLASCFRTRSPQARGDELHASIQPPFHQLSAVLK